MQKHPDIQAGMSLYNYADAYSLCGVASSFFPDIYSGNIGTVFLPIDPDKEIGHCYSKHIPDRKNRSGNIFIPYCGRFCHPASNLMSGLLERI